MIGETCSRRPFLRALIASLSVRLDAQPIKNFANIPIPILLLAVRDHLSHRLMRTGLSKRLAVNSLWIITIYFAAIAILISHAPYEIEGLISAVGAVSWIVVL